LVFFVALSVFASAHFAGGVAHAQSSNSGQVGECALIPPVPSHLVSVRIVNFLPEAIDITSNTTAYSSAFGTVTLDPTKLVDLRFYPGDSVEWVGTSTGGPPTRIELTGEATQCVVLGTKPAPTPAASTQIVECSNIPAPPASQITLRVVNFLDEEIRLIKADYNLAASPGELRDITVMPDEFWTWSISGGVGRTHIPLTSASPQCYIVGTKSAATPMPLATATPQATTVAPTTASTTAATTAPTSAPTSAATSTPAATATPTGTPDPTALAS